MTFWSCITLLCVFFSFRTQTVRIWSVASRKVEGGAVVVDLRITNPTEHPVDATIVVVFGTSGSVARWGLTEHRFPVTVPAKSSINCNKKFEKPNLRFATVVSARITDIQEASRLLREHDHVSVDRSATKLRNATGVHVGASSHSHLEARREQV